jgi:hydroxyacylglutathione hydrolase/adenylyltransferase/sulfurtransferase
MTDEDDTEVGPDRAAELIGDGGVQLVDVREDHEVAAGRLAGSRHIGLAELAAQAETISRDEPVLFYCRTGARSAMATEAFRRAGYEAYNLSGGLVAWHEQGRALEPEDGYVA